MGMEVSEQNGLLCVELDTGSIFSGYSEYIKDFNDTLAQIQYDLSKKLYQSAETQAQVGIMNSYAKGQSVLYLRDGSIKKFRLPQSDSFGICDNYKSPSFLTSISDKSCYQKFQDLSQVCTSIFNPQQFSSTINFLRGSSTGSTRFSISVSKIYQKNSITGEITQLDSNVPSSTYDAVACSCSNQLLEAHYTLLYTPTSNGYFTANSMSVILVIADSALYDVKYCTQSSIATNQPILVKQIFSFEFLVFQTTSGLYKSGNPGYIKGLPLLASFGSSDGIQQVRTQGLRLYSKNNQGLCFTAASTITDFQTDSVNFGQDLSLSCKVNLNAAQLKSYCQKDYSTLSFQKPNLKIFSQLLSEVKSIGVFGSANPAYQGDWKSIVYDDLSGFQSDITNDQQYDETMSTCNLMAGLEFEVLTSKLGFLEDPQNYVIGVRVTGIYDQWSYNQIDATTAQSFSHFARVKFVEALPEDLLQQNTPTSGLLPKLPYDLFYPLTVQSDAGQGEYIKIQAVLLVAVGSVLALLIL
ncbi:UNKNOWN [Stylonychia lemnae]|uniref:Uncharacterized protein n=1 Tax=Stylonychia lemnae TaxID=5949 RepID=A0A078AH25_STYLE|nr:UNKNOWN [Stylonychia lemnae]|eukprot:CDW81539.1 UNKNOWN [Stylonychia lemnae]